MANTTDNRFRNGTFLVYPDSAPANWIEILRMQQVPFIVSPLHDKDKDLSEFDGDLVLLSKKAHWHVAILCDGNKPLSYFQELSDSVNGTHAWKIQNVRSMLRYFLHLDNPEKYQYPQNELREYGGASFQAYMELEGRQLLAETKKIVRYCKEHRITSFVGLVDQLVFDGEDDWLYIVSRQCTLFFSSYLRDAHFISKEKQNEV